MNGLGNLLTVLEAGKYVVRVLADLASGEGSQSGLQPAIFTYPHGLERGSKLSPVSYQGTDPVLRALLS